MSDHLTALGIEKTKARFALAEFGGDVEAAADWCFAEVQPGSRTRGVQSAELTNLHREEIGRAHV